MGGDRRTRSGLTCVRAPADALRDSAGTLLPAAAMFFDLDAAPPDPILGLMAQCQADGRSGKIDLGVGVYRDGSGRTPIPAAVREAERLRLVEEDTKAYQGMAGDAAFNAAIESLALGEHAARRDGRIATVQTPGGTGALRVAAELIRLSRPGARVWLSDPTWDNHASVFRAAGLAVASYPYFDPATSGLRADAMLDALRRVPAGDVVLLHACCHNPTGVDIPDALWPEIVDVALHCGFLPLVDMAYQGFGRGLDEDAAGARLLAARVPEMLLCVSASKNFGLYRERTGAISLVAADAAQLQAARSVMLGAIRNLYSMPPAHGAAVVSRILTRPALDAMWRDELAAMRTRLQRMRMRAVEELAAAGADRDFGFIARQRGMFSLLGLAPARIERLRERHAVYVAGSGRINVAGLNESNVGDFARAVAAVVR